MMSPPSSTGISRLSPAPEADEPTLTVLPGNLVVTFVSTPDSFAILGSAGEEPYIGYSIPDSPELQPCFAP